MLISKKNRREVYKYLFKGALQAGPGRGGCHVASSLAACRPACSRLVWLQCWEVWLCITSTFVWPAGRWQESAILLQAVC